MSSLVMLWLLGLPPVDIEPPPEPVREEVPAEAGQPIEAPPGEALPPSEGPAPVESVPVGGIHPVFEQPTNADVAPREVRPPRPIVWRVDLGVAGGQTISFDQDYLGLDDNLRMPGFHVELRADGRLGQSRVFLGGVLSYDRGSARGTVHHEIEVVTRAHDPLLGLRLAVSIFEGLDPYVEVAGGPSIQTFEVSSIELSQVTRATGNLSAVAGVNAYLPKPWLARRQASRATAGLDFGLGYRYRGEVRIEPEHLDQPGDIDSSGPDLGRVALRGLVWRLGLFVRFM